METRITEIIGAIAAATAGATILAELVACLGAAPPEDGTWFAPGVGAIAGPGVGATAGPEVFAGAGMA